MEYIIEQNEVTKEYRYVIAPGGPVFTRLGYKSPGFPTATQAIEAAEKTVSENANADKWHTVDL